MDHQPKHILNNLKQPSFAYTTSAKPTNAKHYVSMH